LLGQRKRSKNTLLRFIREPQFDQFFEQLSGSYPRLHELDLAIEWALSRAPDRFQWVEPDYYIWKQADILPDLPQIEILYRYDQDSNVIYLIRARIVP
jgi:hypothetical protein